MQIQVIGLELIYIFSPQFHKTRELTLLFFLQLMSIMRAQYLPQI